MPSSRIKEFVNQAFLKMKIALAFCIIMNTPPGKTAVEYVKEMQEAISKHLQDGDDPFENRTDFNLLAERLALVHQQRSVANHLSSIIPSIADPSQSTSSSKDTGYNSCEIEYGGNSQMSSLFSDYETPLKFSEDVRKTLNTNFDFVRGLIRLQDLIGKGDEVVGNMFETVVNEINRTTSTFDSRTVSQDMGVVSIRGKSNYSVPTSVIQYALQASSAEKVVKKSVQDIQQHLCAIALKGTELPYIILNWEGSLLQHSVTIIRKLSDEKPYQKAIVKSTGGFATILITDLLKNYGLEMNMKFEYQVTLLLQLCGNAAVCSEVINILMEKINMLSSKCVAVHQPTSTLSSIERTIGFESSFYIFYLTEKLLIRYFTLQQISNASHENSPNKSSKEVKITELWRGAWNNNDRNKTSQNVPCQLGDCTKLAQSWYVTLQNAAKVFSLNYPLITIYANKCSNLISVNQRKAIFADTL